MRRIRGIVLLTGLLLTGIAAADDSAVELTPAAKAFIADLERSSTWELPPLAQTSYYSDEFLRPLPDIHFADNSLLARLSQLRRVSFYTFMQREDTRLFLGVNDEGLVGIHFNAYRQ